VRIVPADSNYFYVPRYRPEVVYVTRYIGTPFIIFGPAYAYGAWFDRDWDWRRRRICHTDRRHWRNGRPIFHPRFDTVHADRDWKPDRGRFKPPERPQMPPRLVQAKVPSPPPSVKPGMRQDGQPRPTVSRPGDKPDVDRENRRDDNRREQVKPEDKPNNPNDPRQFPTVRRGDYHRDDRPALGRPDATPQPNVEQPRHREQPASVEPTKRIETRQEPRQTERPRQEQRQEPRQEQQRVVEQPKPQPQAQPQPQQQQRQAPSKRTDEELLQRGPRR
jgi:hypothetical protein